MMPEVDLVSTILDKGILYSVGAIVVFKLVKDFISNRNGKSKKNPVIDQFGRELYSKMLNDQISSAVSSGIKGQAQICARSFKAIEQRLESGDKRMQSLGGKLDDMINAQAERHSKVMEAIGNLNGRMNGNRPISDR